MATRAVMILCVMLALLCLFPVTMGIFNIGVWFPPVVLMLIFIRIALIKRDKITGRVWRGLLTAIQAAFFICLAAAVVLSGFMAAAAVKRNDAPKVTLILLGCQVRGEEPSLMLQNRIDAAAEYLNEHPETPAIVSGGQGENESISEAEAMRRALIEAGIAPARIYTEDASVNTSENMAKSMEIIKREGLARDVVIATSEYHALRAEILANKAGCTSAGACTSRTAWYLIIPSWVREWFGIARALLLGY